MKLSELVEQKSIKTISQETMISEENLKRIFSEDYEDLTKAKALGFLSILEREYPLDLKDVRHNAATYFDLQTPKKTTSTIAMSQTEEKQGRSKWFIFIILGLLGYASWYFITQFDKKTLHTLIPASSHTENDIPTKKATIEDKNKEIFSVAIDEDTTNVSELITKIDSSDAVETPSSKIVSVEKVTTTVVSTALPHDNVVPMVEEVRAEKIEQPVAKIEKKKISIVSLKPVKSVWFGLVNMRTGKRDHFSIHKPYSIDLNEGNWLLATSPAPFSLVFGDKTNIYNNGKAHYFMVTQDGIISLTKRAYVAKGGYKKW